LDTPLDQCHSINSISLASDRWHHVAEKVANNLAENTTGSVRPVSLTSFGSLPAFYEILGENGQVWCRLIHPLWKNNHPSLSDQSYRCITVFDALRRPGWCILLK
jgi:hypothetical protein